MPHLRFRALNQEQTQKLSQDLLPELAQIVNTAEDNFTFELVDTQFFYKGKTTESFPFVEVFWFERPQEVQDKVATFITDKVKSFSKADDVVVVFTELKKSSYYENGKHF